MDNNKPNWSQFGLYIIYINIIETIINIYLSSRLTIIHFIISVSIFFLILIIRPFLAFPPNYIHIFLYFNIVS